MASCPNYAEVYKWLMETGWLVLQYSPARIEDKIGAELLALSPAGVEWRFRFNTSNELSGWSTLAECKISG